MELGDIEAVEVKSIPVESVPNVKLLNDTVAGGIEGLTLDDGEIEAEGEMEADGDIEDEVVSASAYACPAYPLAM